MSTRSIIAKENADGTLTGIYCHNDGYPDHNGAILVYNYTNEHKIDQLMKLGDLSFLGPEIGEKHAFDIYNNKWCTAYSRDRGEQGTNAIRYKNLEEIFERNQGQSYIYIWDQTCRKWNCYTADQTPVSLADIKPMTYKC